MKNSKKYLFLMVALTISLFFSSLRQPWANSFVAFCFLLSIIAAAYSASKSRRQLLTMLALSVSAVLPLWEIALSNKTVIETVNNPLWLILTFYVGSIFFQDILKDRRISINEIHGAISVYLLIGIFFGMVFQIVAVFDPNALYFNPTNFTNATPSDGEYFYYSFITLTTVGYGDVSPVAPIARSVSMIEAILGVMYVATMIARFVGIHTNKDG